MFTLLVFTSCTKEREYPEISDTLKNGNWQITEFYHVDRYETDAYVWYKISFAQDEVVTASGVNFYTGSWRITTNGDLQLDFGNSYQFDRFNAIWKIINYNDQMIQLDIMDGSDHLVLEKIQ